MTTTGRTLLTAAGLMAAGLALALVISAPAQAQTKRITIGTNAAGTLYNQVGTYLATLIQKDTGAQTTTRPFAGTSVYLPLLHRGEVDFGLNSSLDSQTSYLGRDEYKTPLKNLRGAVLIARAYYGFYVKASSGLENVAQLKGKAVVMRYRAIASFDRVNSAVLETAGLTDKDVQGVTMSGIPDTIRGLVEGRVESGAVVIGIPALREANAAVSGGLRVLELGPNLKALEQLAGFTSAMIKPSPAFVGVSKPMNVVRFDVFLNTGAHLSPDEVYKVVKIVHQNWQELQKNIPALRAIPASDLVPANFGHPYHDGAIRYFKEAGLWTPAHQTQQDAVLKQ
jgi:hypothetical protein